MQRNNNRDSRPLPRSPEDRRCQPFFIMTLVLKLMIVVLSSVILALTANWYESYMVAIIIGTCSCTLLYVAVSVMVEFFIMCTCPSVTATCHVAETVCSYLFLSVWLLCCGIATQVSLSAGNRITGVFGWVGACTGLGTGVFIATSALYTLQVLAPYVQRKV